MRLSDTQIKQILTSGNYISPEDMASAEQTAVAGRTTLIEALLAKNFITNDLLGQALAEWNGVIYADLNSRWPRDRCGARRGTGRDHQCHTVI